MVYYVCEQTATHILTVLCSLSFTHTHTHMQPSSPAMYAMQPRQWRLIEAELLSQQFVPTARPYTVWHSSTTGRCSQTNRW